MTQVQPQPQSNMTAAEKEQQFREWTQKEYVRVSKYCSSKGYQLKGLDQTKCQSLPPLLGIWYVKTTEKKLDLWVISGDFPTDIANAEVAKNAREAIRYFSMSWHIQVAKLEDGLAEGKISLQDKETQEKFAKDLTTRAENLYDIYAADKLWENTGLTQ